VAKLSPGLLVAGQYEVAGCLAHGGLGWIYLARDRKVADRWVVLKGLINTGDEDAMAAALAERRFLAEVEHPNIVKIHNFVEYDGDGYIVMEYVNGLSLRGILEARRAANGDRPDPLPADQAIAYVLEILPALGHLHDLGLLFCDFKPDNVVQTTDSVKLIDLGGVYRMDDRTSPVYGTAGYQAPEIARTGPTVPSDLFTVARTLMVLCTDFRGHRGTYQYTVPPAADVPLFARYDSLHRFLERATSAEPDDRFQSADEMAAQLVGVLREVVATSTGVPAPGVSTCFTGEARRAPSRADWQSLPLPLVSPDDPGASLVSSLGAMGPEALLEALEAVAHPGVEIDLRRARALMELGLFDDAAAVLDSLEAAMARSNQRTDWRVPWHRGLLALAAEDSERASRCFEIVNRHLPGELAPRLAMAYAAEASGDHAAATVWYDIVSRIDPGYTQAAFGLARARLAMDDRPGAIEAYGRIPDSSSAHEAARIAQVAALLDGDAGGAEMPDVRQAATIVDGLGLEGEQRYRLTASVLEAAFGALHRNGTSPDPSTMVLGYPCTDRGLRLGLEQTYRAVARHARTASERIALVDRANSTRPRSWW
jgi:serine/threonine-protein kinase PknG